MKIQKVIFLMPKAVEVVSKRFGIPPLKDSDIFLLYTIQYLPRTTRASAYRHIKDMGYSMVQPTFYASVGRLLSYELIESDKWVYRLTWKGREYLTAIRRYLLNTRLS